jgi:hypothetical protein
MRTAVIKKRILQKVEKASDADLQRILDYIETLREREKRKKEILSYAGIFADMPDSFWKPLTVDLIKSRTGR